MLVKQCVVFFAALQALSAAEGCQTPNGQDGECKPIINCPILLHILERKPMVNSTTANYLRKSHCGFEGTLPKVCCPIGSALPPNTTEDATEKPGPIKNSLLPGLHSCGMYSSDRMLGEQTDFEEIPWTAVLEYELPDGGQKVSCGGALISKRYVLTAAHCLKGKDLPKTWKLVRVRFGDHNIKTDPDCYNYGESTDCAPPPVSVPVEESLTHESYNPDDINQYHDIALLRLKQEVNFTDFIFPVCLPQSPSELENTYAGKKLVLSGWGINGTRWKSDVKLKVNVPVEELEQCKSKYKSVNVQLGNGQLCAGSSKQDSCRGDSGGPLMALTVDEERNAYFYLAGVLSLRPTPCGFVEWPVVYTRVSKYMKWITQKIRA